MSKYFLKESMYRLLDRLASETVRYTKALKSGDPRDQLKQQAESINEIISRIKDERSSARNDTHE